MLYFPKSDDARALKILIKKVLLTMKVEIKH